MSKLISASWRSRYRFYEILVGGLCLCAFLGCGQSPHDVVARGNLETLAEMLTEKPELVEARNELGKTPLHYAVSYKQPEGIGLLLEEGADMDAQDNTGMTALHVAAMLGRQEEATLLLEAGADVQLQDGFGDTPLHTAAIHGQGHLIPLFNKAGIPLEAQNDAGKTPLDLAVKHGHERLAEMLAERMGVPVPERADIDKNTSNNAEATDTEAYDASANNPDGYA